MYLSRSIWVTVPVWTLPDKRSDGGGRTAQMKGDSMVQGGMIGIRHAIKLPQVVQPRLGHERLDVTLFMCRIVRKKPTEGAVSLAHEAHLLHGAEKVLSPLRVDAVFGLHHDGTLLQARFDEQSGHCDMPGSQILLFAVRQMPAQSRDQPQDSSECCQQDRQWISQARRQRSPE